MPEFGVIATAVKHMLAAGMAPDAIVQAVAEMEAAIGSTQTPKSLTPRQARNRRYYEATRLKASENRLIKTESDDSDGLSPEQKVSPRPLSKTQTPDSPLSPPKGGTFPSLAKLAAFERFWSAYPRKVGKRSAQAAFGSAWQRVGTEDPLDVIVAGLERAKRSDDWRRDRKFIPHPATWLNRDGWDDELDAPPLAERAPSEITAEAYAGQVQHYRDTGEWKPSWGPPPEVGADILPFPDGRLSA